MNDLSKMIELKINNTLKFLQNIISLYTNRINYMKNIFFIAFSLFISNYSFTQKKPTPEDHIKDHVDLCDNSYIRSISEYMPEFNGNNKKLGRKVTKAIKEKNYLNLKQFEETIYLEFIITCKGTALFNQILKTPDEKLGKLIVEAINKTDYFQNWSSAMQRGEKVDNFLAIVVKIKNGMVIFNTI